MSANEIKLKMVEGKDAPKYHGTGRIELVCDEVVITEKATVGGLPIVDFKMKGPGGHTYLMVLTGRIVNCVSAAVKGSNMRNHGVEEP